MNPNTPNPKLSLFPHHTAIDAEGQLTFQGHRAADLARQYGAPLYLYEVETIRRQIKTYRQSLARYSGQARLTYASKAFQGTALARLMTAEGVGLDVASAGEIFIARHGGADPAEMHMHGNNKTIQDLAYALQAGVGRIVLDNEAELERLVQLARERRQQVKIWLRITPGVAVEVHRYMMTGAVDSKFGFPLAEAEAVAGRLLSDPAAEAVQLTGLHIHLGSHFHDAEPVAEALDMLLELALSLREKYGWQLHELCAGGGWGVPYHPEDPPMPVDPFVAGLIAAVEYGCQRRGLPLPTFILEPGRSLVAQAGVALYTVGGRKVIPGVRTYVSIDGGLADNPRPALYQARYTALLANRAQEPEVETVAIAGPFCESGDVMIQAVTLPIARPGDILAVPVAGAYHLAMGSNYNAALRPAVIFIEGDEVKLVQRRETLEDLVRRDS
jgi:diaminopimelate decarboxylase